MVFQGGSVYLQRGDSEEEESGHKGSMVYHKLN